MTGPVVNILALGAIALTACGMAPATADEANAGRQVQISIGYSVTLPAGASTATGLQWGPEALRRGFYEQLTRECELLRATIATSCSLTSANVNINEQRYGQPSPYLQVSGNGTFVIELKGP